MPSEELSSAQIDALTLLLQQKQVELVSQLEDNRDSVEPVTLDQQSVGRVSRMDAIQHQQMSKANRKQDEILLKDIITAFERIKADEYGYCLQCGEAIGFARLQVQPQAIYCIACQSSLEQG
jgi:DnaK suppressor protein